MNMQNTINNLIQSLIDVICNIPDELYNKNLPLFNGGTLGQHCRHIYEFCEILYNYQGIEPLSYDDRKRDLELENSKEIMILKLKEIQNHSLDQNIKFSFPLLHKINKEESIKILTTFERELLFVLDHTIHHMAIIRIGIEKELPRFELPYDFGFTPSTLLAKKV